MPDYLSDCAPPYGVVDRATHDGGSDADEVAWLETRLQCFLELPALEAVGMQKWTRYPLSRPRDNHTAVLDSRPRDSHTAEVHIWFRSVGSMRASPGGQCFRAPTGICT